MKSFFFNLLFIYILLVKLFYISAQLLQVSSRSASKSYLKMVDNSYLGTCDEVRDLGSVWLRKLYYL